MFTLLSSANTSRERCMSRLRAALRTHNVALESPQLTSEGTEEMTIESIGKKICVLATVGAVTIASAGCSGADGDQGTPLGAAQQRLWSQAGTAYWPNGVVRVCFVDDQWPSYYTTQQILAMRDKIEAWVVNEISPFAKVNFTDFTVCNPNFPGPAWLRIVGKAPGGSSNSHVGHYTSTDNRIWFKGLPSKATVLHEFMHALGYNHEFDHIDTDECEDPAINNPVGTFWTRYDHYSIMNSTGYCHSRRNLSAWDREGLASTYGDRTNVFNASFAGGDTVDPTWTNWVSVVSRARPGGGSFTTADILVGNFVDESNPAEEFTSDDFLATTGSGWYISPKGYQPWQVATNSSVTAADLLVGDFNGDGFSDVFHATGSVWRVSYSGTSSWVQINTSSITKSQLLIGDFTGDGKSDVLRVSGGKWYISNGGTGSFVEINTSSAPIVDLKVGNFDGTGGDDIFYGDGTTWRYSSGATGSWQHLANSSVKGRDLLVGNFDGTGGDDVFATINGTWRVSSEARNNWTTVATSSYTVAALRVANFGLGHGFGASSRVRHSVFTH